MNDEREKQLDLLAEMASYGVSWALDDSGNETAYTHGVLEGVAHMVACCLVQWGFTYGEALPTDEAADALELREYPDRYRLRRLLDELCFEFAAD